MINSQKSKQSKFDSNIPFDPYHPIRQAGREIKRQNKFELHIPF